MSLIEKLAEHVGQYPFEGNTLNEVAVELKRHATPASHQFRKQVIEYGQHLLSEAQRVARQLQEAESKSQRDLVWAMVVVEGENYLRAFAQEKTLPWQLARILQTIDSETAETMQSKHIMTDDIGKLQDFLKVILTAYVVRTKLMPLLAQSSQGNVEFCAYSIKGVCAELRKKYQVLFERVPPTFAMML